MSLLLGSSTAKHIFACCRAFFPRTESIPGEVIQAVIDGFDVAFAEV